MHHPLVTVICSKHAGWGYRSSSLHLINTSVAALVNYGIRMVKLILCSTCIMHALQLFVYWRLLSSESQAMHISDFSFNSLSFPTIYFLMFIQDFQDALFQDTAGFFFLLIPEFEKMRWLVFTLSLSSLYLLWPKQYRYRCEAYTAISVMHLQSFYNISQCSVSYGRVM